LHLIAVGDNIMSKKDNRTNKNEEAEKMEAVLSRIAPIGSAKRIYKEVKTFKKLESASKDLRKILNFNDSTINKALKEAREECWKR